MTTATAKPFNIGDILSITTGRLVSPRGMEGIYDILNHMTGDEIYTHVIGRAIEACRPVLLADHPFLAAWGEELVAQLAAAGESAIGNANFIAACLLPFQRAAGCSDLMVLPLSPDQWLRIDPLKELEAMVGEDRVIPIVI